MKLIGFSGKMGSGKTTATECMNEFSHGRVKVIKLAAPLYRMQENIYDEIASVYTRPDDFKKDRKLLQFLGTEWGRSISTSIWIDIWKQELHNTKLLDIKNNTSTIIVCDDVRYDNEASALKEMGGILLLMRSDVERISSKEGITGHISENGVDFKYVDFIIDNNGAIDDLKTSLLLLNSYKAIW